MIRSLSDRAHGPRAGMPGMRTWLAAIVGSVLAISGLAAALALSGVDPGSAAHPPPSSGSPSAVGWQPPHRSWAALPSPDESSELLPMQINGLNEVVPPPLVGCPAPRVVADEEQWESDVRAQWSCLHRAWAPTLTSHGWSAAEPAVRFFQGGGSDSQCGYVRGPAFYCPAGAGAVFVGAGHFEMARHWRLSVNEMVNHEYVHHLQNVAGITAARLRLQPTSELERRSELQATCLSATLTRANEAVAFDGEDYESWTRRVETMLADPDHGTRASLTYWGLRGLYAHTLGDCNTWRAPSRWVA